MKKTFVSAAYLAILAASASAQTQPPVEALVYSTMPSTSAHRPEMAMDGDNGTYFASAYGMEEGDDFLVTLSRPIPVSTLHVVTGDADGVNVLDDGVLEVSSDTVNFSKAADFSTAGVANASLQNKDVIAIRIRLHAGKGLAKLVIREVTIDSPVKVSHVQYGPPRGFIDVSQAKDLADWAQRAEKQMESFWPDTTAILYTDGFITPNAVNVIYRTGPEVTPVAATGGGVMTVNSAYCRTHPNDTALTVHETAHVVQSTGSNAPGWLIEGVADYIRWVKYEPQNFHPRINPDKATYHDAYQTSATFLGWVTLHYDSQIVTKLNKVCRVGGYSNDLFKQYSGKDVDTLWSEFIAAFKADPTHIISEPTPAAMLPRALPAVQAGTSVSVDISSLFDIGGVAKDGSKFSTSGGFDEGGASYSSTLLPSSVTSKNVSFKLGPADAADAVSAKGNVIALPSGAHHSLWLLASAINGANKNQTVVVTYEDGTQQSFAQNFSDWYLPESFPGEVQAVKTAYRDMADGSRDGRSFYVYSYGYALDASKKVKSVTLPNAPDLRVLAVSLAD